MAYHQATNRCWQRGSQQGLPTPFGFLPISTLSTISVLGMFSSLAVRCFGFWGRGYFVHSHDYDLNMWNVELSLGLISEGKEAFGSRFDSGDTFPLGASSLRTSFA